MDSRARQKAPCPALDSKQEQRERVLNYHRLERLREMATPILLKIFHTRWTEYMAKIEQQTGTGSQWVDGSECGEKLVKICKTNAVPLVGIGIKEKMRAGDTNMWDVTMLTTAIQAITKSILKGIAYVAENELIDTIRTVRNDISHRPRLEVGQQEFDSLWPQMATALTQLGVGSAELETVKVMDFGESMKALSEAEHIKASANAAYKNGQPVELPEVNFLCNEIAKLMSILGNQIQVQQVEEDANAVELNEALAAEQPGGRQGTSSAAAAGGKLAVAAASGDGKEKKKKYTFDQQIAMDTIKQTPQPAPPLDSGAGYTHRDLVVRPEQIAQLWSGLGKWKFAKVLSGMFVNFDFYGLNYTIATVNAKKEKKRSRNLNSCQRYQFLPITKVTFDAPTPTPVPFLSSQTSNARLHIDPRVELFDNESATKVTALPIPQTEKLLTSNQFTMAHSVLSMTNYEFPSLDYVESKVRRLWLALEKAKTTGASPNGANGCVPN